MHQHHRQPLHQARPGRQPGLLHRRAGKALHAVRGRQHHQGGIGPGGADLPKDYWHTHDPFVALAAMAAVTERIQLGTGICLVVERDPIQLAKQVASLDMISNGRVILGVGAGWNAEEMENHGVAFATRWKVVREKVLAMKTIWSEDEPEYHGDFVNFDKLWSWPKPVQPGGPPVWLGAQSKWAFDRVADYCDGWMPIGLMGGLGDGIEALHKACDRAGLCQLDCFIWCHLSAMDQAPPCVQTHIFECPFDRAGTPVLLNLCDLSHLFREVHVDRACREV